VKSWSQKEIQKNGSKFFLTLIFGDKVLIEVMKETTQHQSVSSIRLLMFDNCEFLYTM
jgi:hypothetical protein